MQSIETKKRKNPDNDELAAQRQKLNVLGEYITVNNDDKKAPAFFNRVIEELGVATPFSNIAFIVVCHIVPTLPFYLEGLKKIGRIATIIRKTNHDERIVNYLRKFPEEFPQAEILRDDIQANPDAALESLQPYIQKTEKIIIIDIGGYFAPCVELFANHPWWSEKLIGVVEDTENGHQDYEKILPNLTKPIYSVARCPLKETEDYNVGKSIYRATDTILRKDAHTYPERLEIVLIIGYGKIGRSIAEHCRKVGLKRIYVAEINEMLKQNASSKHFSVCDLADILPHADMIFCATGNKCLTGEMWSRLKSNVFIASVTSADKELDLEYLVQSFQKTTTGHIDQYRKDDKQVNLLFGGNAVNFVDGAVNGPYIYSVQAALITASIRLIQDAANTPLNTMNELPNTTCQVIAKVWNETFEESIRRNELEPISVTSNEIQKTKIFNVPEPSAHFVGRRKIIETMRARLTPRTDQPPMRLKVTGMGGIGKTELSLKLAWQIRDESDNVIFIQAEDKTAVSKQIIEIAKKHQIQIDEEDLMVSFYHQLASKGSTLIIFDNVDLLEDVEPYLPSTMMGYTANNFNVLVTSRNQRSWLRFADIHIDVAEESMQVDAIEYIQHRVECSDESSRSLAETLQFFPLAITQAVSYILQNAVTVQEYTEMYREQAARLQLLRHAADDVEQKHKNTVLLTWRISINQLSKSSHDLLQSIAYLSPDEIFIEFFKYVQTYKDDVQDLLRYSLISIVNREPYSFKIHRLLQEVIRDSIENPDDILRLAVAQLNQGVYYDRENLTPVVQRAPHIECLLNFIQSRNCGTNDFAALCYTIGLYYLDHLYDHEKAYALLKYAKQILISLEQEVPVKYVRQFAKACMRLEKTDEAAAIYEQPEALLASLETEYERHTFKIDKALYLKSIKRYGEAETLINGVLEAAADNNIRARCHSYLAGSCIARLYARKKLLATMHAELAGMPSWRNDRPAKVKRIEEQEKILSTLLGESIDHLTSALSFNTEENESKQIISSKLSIIRLFIEFEVKERQLIESIVLLACSLYENDLQTLNRPTHSSLLNRCAITVAQFLSKQNPTFERMQKAQWIREVLAGELQSVEQEQGTESEQYKKLHLALKTKQAGLLQFFAPVSAQVSPVSTQASPDSVDQSNQPGRVKPSMGRSFSAGL